MMTDPYVVKALEYLTSLTSALLFVAFWRFVNGGGARVVERARAWSGRLSEWFRVPERVFFHSGHGWARLDGPGVMTVGVDDFAQQLVGPLAALTLPDKGAPLRAGERAWSLNADSKAVDMLAPVTGTVVDVNRAAIERPELVNDDPYGRGWLLKVQVPRTATAVRPLLTGAAARKWIDQVSEQLMNTMSPELGQLCQDGGLPVHCIARGIDEAHWDEVARKFLLS